MPDKMHKRTRCPHTWECAYLKLLQAMARTRHPVTGLDWAGLAGMDSDSEAFSGNPTDGSFAVLAFQLAAFTKYLNEVFLSY